MQLYKELIDVRNKLGDKCGYMPYMIASNKTLLSLTEIRPTSIEQLGKSNFFETLTLFI